MIDLHAHILPGIDDGADTFEEAVAMCFKAAREGCRGIVATPHQRHPRWWNNDTEALDRLRRELEEAVGDTLKIYSGGEVRVDSEFLDSIESGDRDGILPLAEGRHILVEFPRRDALSNPEETVHELVVDGWFPVIAHPELIPWLADDLPKLERMVSLGGRLQLTAMSFTGDFGKSPREAARTLVDEGLAHFVASDCHGLNRRPPGLKSAFEHIAARWGHETAHRLTRENPTAVVENRPVDA